MRRALAIALVGGCTTANPAFDPKDRNDTASADATAAATAAGESDDADDADTGIDACSPPEPAPLVTFDAELPCEGGSTTSFAGMVVGQSGSAVSVAPCADACPCESQDGWIGFVLHPTIVLPVFPECIAVEVTIEGSDCFPAVFDIWALDGGSEHLLVHAEDLRMDGNPLALEVDAELQDACDCEPCVNAVRPSGRYGLTFASSIDEVGPMSTGGIAEMMVLEGDVPTRFVVATLDSSLDCDCSVRREILWSVTRG